MMRAPSAGCRFINARSVSEKRPGLVRISSGIFTFPISCSSPATPNARTSRAERPRDSASLGGVDRGKREAGQRLVEKRLEFLAAHGVGKLQALDPRQRQPPPPVPCLELA